MRASTSACPSADNFGELGSCAFASEVVAVCLENAAATCTAVASAPAVGDRGEPADCGAGLQAAIAGTTIAGAEASAARRANSRREIPARGRSSPRGSPASACGLRSSLITNGQATESPQQRQLARRAGVSTAQLPSLLRLLCNSSATDGAVGFVHQGWCGLHWHSQEYWCYLVFQLR
jgi:hypothetical protein